MRVVEVPSSLDYRNVDTVFAEAAAAGAEPVLFDARRLRWIDPNGMLALLCAGQVASANGATARLSLPAGGDVVGYLDRMGFPAAAARVFRGSTRRAVRTPSRASDVLLEITSVATNSDVHDVVDRVQSRAGAILSRTLRYPLAAVVQFSVILSEVCQNIVEHADGPGWVAAQRYNWNRRLGRQVLVIGVSDVGRGFRDSLAEEHAERFGDRWGDVTALEAAFLMGLTRFPDTGRGQGIQQIRKQVARWQGLVSIRSGTARIADSPSWHPSPPVVDGLPRFPGAQINLVLPSASMTERLARGRRGDGPALPGAIDVAAIVTDTVVSRGHNLVTRPTGRAVREAIEQRLARMSASPVRTPLSPQVTLIDFTRVRILDFSCADEVVAKLLLRYQGPDRPGNIFFLFRAVDEMHRHAVEEVLERHGLAAVCDVGGGFQLLGPATPEERKAWDTLERCERIGPRDLAGALGELGEPLLRGLARRRLAYWSGNGGAAALSALARTR